MGIIIDMKDIIEDNLCKAMADEIRREIDWEIMKKLYVQAGYTEVTFYPIRPDWEAHLISAWCKEKVEGRVHSLGSCWMFEKAEDAMMFRLRWGA
jgi:hypothetical protein